MLAGLPITTANVNKSKATINVNRSFFFILISVPLLQTSGINLPKPAFLPIVPPIILFIGGIHQKLYPLKLASLYCHIYNVWEKGKK